MKGCRPRQGGEFKDSFLPRLLFDLRQNRRDEPLVWEPSCRWANSQSHSVQYWYFVNSNKGDQWTDPDNASDKYAELMNTDRAWLMDIFWVHWNQRRWSVQKSSNKGPLLETHVSVRLILLRRPRSRFSSCSDASVSYAVSPLLQRLQFLIDITL